MKYLVKLIGDNGMVFGFAELDDNSKILPPEILIWKKTAFSHLFGHTDENKRPIYVEMETVTLADNAVQPDRRVKPEQRATPQSIRAEKANQVPRK